MKVFVAGLLFLLACLFNLNLALPAEIAPTQARKTAPEFQLADPDGTAVNLAQHRGKVVLLDFWATWCHGCKTEIPWYEEFASRYKARGLDVIGVSMDGEGWKVVKPFIAEKRINYTIVLGNDDLAQQYSVRNMPVTLLIDRQGKIADSHAGVVDKDQFEKEIQKLLLER